MDHHPPLSCELCQFVLHSLYMLSCEGNEGNKRTNTNSWWWKKWWNMNWNMNKLTWCFSKLIGNSRKQTETVRNKQFKKRWWLKKKCCFLLVPQLYTCTQTAARWSSTWMLIASIFLLLARGAGQHFDPQLLSFLLGLAGQSGLLVQQPRPRQSRPQRTKLTSPQALPGVCQEGSAHVGQGPVQKVRFLYPQTGY